MVMRYRVLPILGIVFMVALFPMWPFRWHRRLSGRCWTRSAGC